MKFPEPPPAGSWGPLDNPDMLHLLPSLHEDVSALNNQYPYWSEFKYKKIPAGVDHIQFWKILKFYRNSTAFKFAPSTLSGFHFKYNLTNRCQELLHHFDLNLGGVLVGDHPIPEEEKTKYLLNSIMEEAIASSQLEGAVTTREVAKEMLRTERKPRNTSERMILNNFLTIKELEHFKGAVLTPELIKQIHATISKDTLEERENEGKFRTNNKVKVVDGATGEVFYTPPDHQLLDQLIEDYCEFANEKNSNFFIHPIVRASILHFLMGYIHPFADGNGRTARAIFYWYLISKGYWLLEYTSISRIIINSPTQYAKAYLYTEIDENDLTYFINYQVNTLHKALESLKQYIAKKVKEKKTIFNLVKSEELNERQVEILNTYNKNRQKFMSIKEVQTKFSVVYQTARTDLMGLVEKGFLEQKSAGKKLLFFASERFEKSLKQVKK